VVSVFDVAWAAARCAARVCTGLIIDFFIVDCKYFMVLRRLLLLGVLAKLILSFVH